MFGYAGNDTIYGGGKYIGGAGADQLFGNDGVADQFIYLAVTDSGVTMTGPLSLS